MRCPEGHESTATDYCDVCGAVMGPAPTDTGASNAAPESATASPPPDVEDVTGDAESARECPSCGAPGLADALFCEACGYDYTTGTMPRAVNALDLDAPDPAPGPVDPDSGATMLRSALPEDAAAQASADPPAQPDTSAPAPPVDAAYPAPAAPHSAEPANPGAALNDPWVAEVWIDPAWYRDQGSPDPMPSPGPPDLVVLRRTSLLVGRASTSRGISPDIDCGVDNGVSRRHAQLTTDGSRWWVEDLDSANGVWVADTVGELPRAPIPARSKREFDTDDRIYVGSWTRIVVRQASQDEVDALA